MACDQNGICDRAFADPNIVPQLGLQSAGALLTATIEKHEDDGLTKLNSASGPIYLPKLDAEIGQTVRVRVLAQDVMLSLCARKYIGPKRDPRTR